MKDTESHFGVEANFTFFSQLSMLQTFTKKLQVMQLI